MRECAVLHPALFKLVEPLRILAQKILTPDKEGAATSTLADAGVALLLDLPEPPKLETLETLASFAETQDLARLSWRAKGAPAVPVAQRRPVRVVFAGCAVDLPEEAFLQASAEADRVLSASVLGAPGNAAHIADLYAGLGTFTFAGAQKAAVHAVEGDTESVKALRGAVARAKLSGRVNVEQRDLARRPLSPQELAAFDAVLFDPPRAGSMAQCRELAASQVPVVVAVSCNPATFARDARILVDGGYRMGRVQPVDSFIWSAQLELTARFARG